MDCKSHLLPQLRSQCHFYPCYIFSPYYIFSQDNPEKFYASRSATLQSNPKPFSTIASRYPAVTKWQLFLPKQICTYWRKNARKRWQICLVALDDPHNNLKWPSAPPGGGEDCDHTHSPPTHRHCISGIVLPALSLCLQFIRWHSRWNICMWVITTDRPMLQMLCYLTAA